MDRYSSFLPRKALAVFFILAISSFSENKATTPSVITYEQISTTNEVPNKLNELKQNKSSINQELLNSLYSQYCIFQKIKDGHGFKGEETSQIFPHLKKIIGRIFIIEKNGELKSGTGVLLKTEEGWRVFTAKHNFKHPDGCLYYFVLAMALNLETGFFNDLPNKAFLKYVLQTLGDPLYTRVQRIFTNNLLKNNQQLVQEKELIQPDHCFQDEVVSFPYEKDLPEGIEDIKVEVLNPAQTAELNEKYFAMGFPMLPQLYAENTDIWLDGIDFACVAPLTLTSSNIPINGDTHHAPTTMGMSGGPVFALGANGNIKIIGLVRGGECKNVQSNPPLDFINYFLIFRQ